MLVLVGALALVIGVALAIFGGGGSLLMLPLLVHGARLDPRQAIAASLFTVGSIAAVGLVAHARAGNVDLRAGSALGVAGMAGAYAGGRVARLIPSAVLIVAFAFVMVATALLMLRGRRAVSAPPRAPAFGTLLLLGTGVGALSGLVGAGGGFLIVPALTLFGGLTMHRAIGTSLAVVSMQSAAGFLGHVAHGDIPWGVVSVVAGSGVLGSIAGAKLVGRLEAERLRRGFAWLLLVMAALLVAEYVSWPVLLVIAGAELAAALAVLRRRAIMGA
jgi:hypothetical protein